MKEYHIIILTACPCFLGRFQLTVIPCFLGQFQLTVIPCFVGHFQLTKYIEKAVLNALRPELIAKKQQAEAINRRDNITPSHADTTGKQVFVRSLTLDSDSEDSSSGRL